MTLPPNEVTPLFESIHELPPVTAEPKIGHWINGDDKCPCCGKSKFEGLDADIWADWRPNYCPNCGAKMQRDIYKPSEASFEDQDTRIVVDVVRCGRVEYTNLATNEYGEIPIDDFDWYYDKIEGEE